MPDPSIFTSVINQYLPEPQASLLNGILFGASLKVNKLFYEQLKSVGLLHIVVLSGMNITILAGMITLLTSSFSKRVSLLATILLIIIFVIFVRPQAPIVRAAIMGILTSVSFIYGKRRFGLYFLLAAGVLMAIIWPHWLKTISFQLSFGAAFGIMLFGPDYNHQVRGHNLPQARQSDLNDLVIFLKKDLRTSLAAQVFTAPLIFLYFRQISLIAPFANLFVSFLIAPLMILGFLTAILGKINFYLGLLPSYLAYGMASYMVWVVEGLSKIPFGYFKI